MQVIFSLDQIPFLEGPIAFTIGVYDGVHTGHELIIKHLHRQTRKEGSRVILTFSNHPSTVVNPSKSVPSIISLEHKLHLFKAYGIDLVIVLPFTKDFAKQPYDVFIQNLYEKLPFSSLTLGDGACLGKDKKGDQEHLTPLANKLNFQLEYTKKETYHKEIISSQKIREEIKGGNLKKVKKLLGRPYSIYTPYQKEEVRKETDNIFKWETNLTSLCPLPNGAYSVYIEDEKGNTFPGTAFLNSFINFSQESNLSCSLLFKESPPDTSHINITFISYLYPENKPEGISISSLLEPLSRLEPSL